MSKPAVDILDDLNSALVKTKVEDLPALADGLRELMDFFLGTGSPFYKPLRQMTDPRELNPPTIGKGPLRADPDPAFQAFCDLGAVYAIFNPPVINPFVQKPRDRRILIGAQYMAGKSVVQICLEYHNPNAVTLVDRWTAGKITRIVGQ